MLIAPFDVNLIPSTPEAGVMSVPTKPTFSVLRGPDTEMPEETLPPQKTVNPNVLQAAQASPPDASIAVLSAALHSKVWRQLRPDRNAVRDCAGW
ncbi:hypothetical protein OSH11_17570 [Kaistia dalseonensis]|uniref:Uncharacterized protein n=1 Tax=Kaistia dalseonensis TaxID=410840 RepID=A0ABU0HA05_9HYPH|nr:hypothetical protein [Kaistia dalseonensis]MCX5496519.1 hypothetical protein [Kaistia dalseonensis]MDQ0439141.1 hypothetical protein [Kaistia dalseonensis]